MAEGPLAVAETETSEVETDGCDVNTPCAAEPVDGVAAGSVDAEEGAAGCC